MASLAAAFVLVVMAANFTQAQEVSEEQLKIAKQAVAASKSTRTLDNILPSLAENAKKQLIANRPDEADQISDIVDEVAISLAPRRGDLEDEVARAYARIFTIDELKAITAFYTSETGKKLIEQTPVVARSIDQAARVWTNGIRRDLQQGVTKKLQEAGMQ
jgi:hypothetical protein